MPSPFRALYGFALELAGVNQRVRALRAELDALKSQLDVPKDLVREFESWRAAAEIPAHPLVSVCIATYNRAELLTERSIPSILAQTYPHLELIVVGDGCTDDTPERVARIKDSRLRFVNLEERGDYPADPVRRWMVAGTKAMNHALSLCQGDYITHLDDDDEHLPTRLEELVRFAIQERCDFVWHPFWFEVKRNRWALNRAQEFAFQQVTTSSVLYRSWFSRVTWNIRAHELNEPGDWNRFRRIRYIGPSTRRYPAPLLRHYRERSQSR